jgi:hypothetical protein
VRNIPTHHYHEKNMAIILDVEHEQKVEKFSERMKMIRLELDQAMRDAATLHIDARVAAHSTNSGHAVSVALFNKITLDEIQ